MKKSVLVLFLLFLFLSILCVKLGYTQTSNVSYELVAIDGLDPKLQAMLDEHINQAKYRAVKKYEFITISISPRVSSSDGFSQGLLDSLYEVTDLAAIEHYKTFRVEVRSYKCCLEFQFLFNKHKEKIYYTKYKGKQIVIVSDTPIVFKKNNSSALFNCSCKPSSSEKDILSSYYVLRNETVMKIETTLIYDKYHKLVL